MYSECNFYVMFYRMSKDWRDNPNLKLSKKEKEESRKEEEQSTKQQETVVGFILLCFFVVLFFMFAINPSIKGVSNFFGDRAAHKARCQTHYTVTSAKTDFAAEQAFKKCMDRQ